MEQIVLHDFVKDVYGDSCDIFNKIQIRKIFEDKIEPVLISDYSNKKILPVSLKGIQSMSASVIVELFLKKFYQFCLKYENMIYYITGFETEFKEELIESFEVVVSGAKVLAKKEENLSSWIIIENDGMEILGFGENEEQYKLLKYLYNSKSRITSRKLMEMDPKLTSQSATNRLSRLYAKRLIYREQIAPKQYEYYGL